MIREGADDYVNKPFHLEDIRIKADRLKKQGLREMRYRFDFEGTKVIMNIMDGVR